MKRFIIKTTKLSLILIVLITLMSFSTILIIKKASFKIDNNKNILVLGASSTECSINDTILTNYLNLSQSAEAYIFTYIKLKKILEVNKHIDTVLLAYTYDILKKGRDEWIIGDTKMRDNISRYISFIGTEELEILFPKYSFWSSLIDLPYLSKRALISFFLKKDFKYSDLRLGRFQFLKRDKLKVDLERRKNNSDSILDEIGEYSEYQNKYLSKIIKLCKNYNVELILFNTPVYTDAIPAAVVEEFYKYHKSHYSDVTFIDCSNFDLDDSHYADVKHLNYKGAKIFSEFIKQNGLSKLASYYSYQSQKQSDSFAIE